MARPNPDTNTESHVFVDLFHDALEAYQAETKRDLHLDTLKQTLRTPEDLLAHIQSQGESFQNFRSKHGKLWARMYAVLGPVAAIGTISQTAVVAAGPLGSPISAVLGAVLYLVVAADGVKDAYDWIETLFVEFEMFSVRLKEYVSVSHDLSKALRDRIGAILTCMLRLFGRAEAMIKAGRFRQYLRTAFLGQDGKTKGLLDELNLQLKNEQSLIIALTFNATRNAEEHARSAAESGDRIEDRLKEISLRNTELVDKLEEQRTRAVSEDQIKEMKQMLETPAADTVARLLSTQKRVLVNGTGGWLEKEAHFSTWRSGRAPILWILGGPGAGKSFLATWTIIHLREYFSQQTDTSIETAVAYFFIKDYDTALVDPNNILKTLALQIADTDSTFGRYVASRCMDRSDTITEDDTWESLFVGFYSSAEAQNHYTILILDGLDEAPASVRKKLLAMVKSVVSKDNRLGDHIQFGIFGRTELRGDFEFHRHEKLIMVSLKNQDDIKNFIVSKLSDIALVRAMESKGSVGQKQAVKLRDTITKKVLHGADGVFLWAKLLMKELEELNSVQIGRVLKNPPQSLDEMISKLFHRISEDERIDNAEVSRMMLFVCFARRPMLFGELKLFLSLPNQQPDVLLWPNIRGRFASLFELKYPDWYDPDAIPETEENQVQEVEPDQTPMLDGDDSTRERPAVAEDEDFENARDDDETPDEDEADFDFDDDNGVNTVSYDLGTAPSEDEAAREYANTIHDDVGQLITSVRFTHQRIKDYLITEGNIPNRSALSNDVWVDVQRAEILMTISCLQALQLGNEKKAHRRYLIDYPAKNFVLHLAKIQEDYLTVEDTKEIVTALVNLFHDDQTAKTIPLAAHATDIGRDEFWNTWIGRQTHREVVQRWLCKLAAETITTDQKVLAWVRKAQSSIVALIEPMMRGASHIWLTKTGYDDQGYRDKSEWIVDLLRAFVSMDDSGTVTDPVYQSWSWVHGETQPPVNPKQLYEVAEWAKLEKTTHWYTGFGWTLINFHCWDQAVAEYDKAIQLDSKAWVAMEGKARCLANQEKYEEAIDLMNRAIANLPPSMSQIGAFLYPQVSQWRENLGDKSGANEAAAQAFAIDNRTTVSQLRYITILCNSNEGDQAVINVLEQLYGWMKDSGISELVELFHTEPQIYEMIGPACRACGAPPFVLEAVDQALDWSQDKRSKRQLVVMTAYAAQFKYRYYSRDSEAVELYERALRLLSETASAEKEENILQARVEVNNVLSLILFDMAVAAKGANEGYSRLSTRLKELSVALDSSLDHHSFEFYNTGYPSLLWGRWLREHEGADESVWRRPFRARLLDQINMLDDDDPANDSYALEAVAKSLFHAGDRENAGAILAIRFKLLEDYISERDAQLTEDKSPGTAAAAVAKETTKDDSGPNTIIGPPERKFTRVKTAKEDTTTTTTTTKQDSSDQPGLKLTLNKDDWLYTCDSCGLDTESVSELYFCGVCDSKNWCNDCLPLVQQTSRYMECGPTHEFYRAWPIPEDRRFVAVTWLGTEPRLRREWLDKLRGQWL